MKYVLIAAAAFSAGLIVGIRFAPRITKVPGGGNGKPMPTPAPMPPQQVPPDSGFHPYGGAGGGVTSGLTQKG